MRRLFVILSVASGIIALSHMALLADDLPKRSVAVDALGTDARGGRTMLGWSTMQKLRQAKHGGSLLAETTNCLSRNSFISVQLGFDIRTNS